MSDVSRRDLLRGIALSASLGALPLEAAQHVHDLALQEKAAGPYKPKAFNDHEYATLRRLADLIVPADDVSPGALAAGAPEFIDLLSSQNQAMAAIYTGGMAWMDREMVRRFGTDFVGAKAERQVELMDLIAYKRNESPELGPGIHFFAWVRKMVVDAFYTSPVGIKDLGYLGNTAVSKFEVPREAVEYALKRSPV